MQIFPSLGFVSGTIAQRHREEYPYKEYSTKQGGIHGCSQYPKTWKNTTKPKSLEYVQEKHLEKK
jgi:hypothetical protein